jgi:DNA/RNA-binding domain of Phe-tRNA-synthetase-like protein
MNIHFESHIREAAPQLQVIVVTADVENRPTGDDLWRELQELSEYIRSEYALSDINSRPAIAATRAAYKACGKDPNRYRPSSEALCRRMVKGMELYRSLSVIDLINLLSVETGHSIGGFDADKIVGDTLTLGVGRADEPYEAIGRGTLNIAGLPVFRDAVGGIGTPTSDNERTKLTEQTSHLLMTINIYGADRPTAQVMELTRRLLENYAGATNVEMTVHQIC